MTDDNSIPDGKLNKLTYSITNLWEDFGRTDSLLLGTVVNVALGALGLAVYIAADGLVAFAGAVWAILCGLAILRGWL